MIKHFAKYNKKMSDTSCCTRRVHYLLLCHSSFVWMVWRNPCYGLFTLPVRFLLSNFLSDIRNKWVQHAMRLERKSESEAVWTPSAYYIQPIKSEKNRNRKQEIVVNRPLQLNLSFTVTFRLEAESCSTQVNCSGRSGISQMGAPTYHVAKFLMLMSFSQSCIVPQKHV